MPDRLRRLRLLLPLGGLLLAVALLALPAVSWAAPLAQAGHGEGGAGGTFFALVPLIVVFPVLGLLLNLLFGKALGERWSGAIGSGAAALAFVIAVLQAVSLRAVNYQAQIVPVADWLNLGALQVPWAFQVDTLSVTMMLVVTGVGALIHVYAIGYMHADVRLNGDPGRFTRFFVYLNLFLTAMLVLVSGSSYLTMFIGWEGVGLCSYLLIGFWYEKGAGGLGNARAARKAFVVNRIGDWAMLLAMFLIFWQFGSLTYQEVFGKLAAMHFEAGAPVLVAITLLLLMGATGKSAQVPLYVWLPDAMAGPTPVSALMHAATMVTAGIYMITRSNALFALAPFSMGVVALIGAATAIFSASIAIGQFDIKKVLAYSTISQLGFMIAAVGLGGYVAGMFHLITHAFFKALLFLSAGSIIHAVEHGHHHTLAQQAVGGGGPDPHAPDAHAGHDHEAGHAAPEAGDHGPAAGHAHDFDPQDMRNMGGLWRTLPITKWVFLIGSLALAGIVPLSGFWSKDEILLDAYTHQNWLVLGLLMVAAFFTAFYCGRQLMMVFAGAPRTDAAKHSAESPALMTVPLIVLAVLAAFGGLLNLPSIAGWTPPAAHTLTNWMDHTLGALPGGEHAAGAEGEAAAGHAAEAGPEGALDFGIAGGSTLVALLGLAAGAGLYRGKPAAATDKDPLESTGPLFQALNRKWWIDELYDLIIIRPYNWLAGVCAYLVDGRFWHDWFHDTVLAGTYTSLARFSAEFLDRGVVDGLISQMPAAIARGVGGGLRRLQSGYVRAYALLVFVGVVLVLGYLLFVAR
ncbi:MAG: NADH-quinone oxidoreductase subunit L [Anaerolineales bacterium]|nr:NADH-quinone oxidoreductase subunit L [Anaerolineales bacterium]